MSVKSNVFRTVTAADRVDYPALESTIQKWWEDQGVLQMYLQRNEHSDSDETSPDALQPPAGQLGFPAALALSARLSTAEVQTSPDRRQSVGRHEVAWPNSR